MEWIKSCHVCKREVKSPLKPRALKPSVQNMRLSLQLVRDRRALQMLQEAPAASKRTGNKYVTEPETPQGIPKQ